jgi:hypothetical protein
MVGDDTLLLELVLIATLHPGWQVADFALLLYLHNKIIIETY